MLAWVLLFVSGVIEAFWPIAFKASDGFTKLGPTAVSILLIASSMYCFTLAVRTIPPALAYVIFVGMGAVGVTITAYFFYKELPSLLQAFCILLIVSGIVGLKLTTSS